MRVSVLDGVEPVAFWQRFEELTKIARPSRHEEPVIAWVKDWAAERGFELTSGRGPEPGDPGAGDAGARGGADR